MAVPRKIAIVSLSSFAKNIEQLLAGTKAASPERSVASNWYRGHSSSKGYKLEPHLYRHKEKKDVAELMKLELEMMREFKRQGMLHNFQQSLEDASSRMALLFYMQHYGVPTRLLDWSSNPFIALYFALSGVRRTKDGECEEDAAVWVLDPYRWNRRALKELTWEDAGPAYADDTRVVSYLPSELGVKQPGPRYPLPIAISGAANTARMVAQRGNFTIFSDDLRPMEVIYQSEKFPKDSLVKLEIPKASIDPVLDVLLSVGYTDSVAYPDLEGLARELKRMYGFIR